MLVSAFRVIVTAAAAALARLCDIRATYQKKSLASSGGGGRFDKLANPLDGRDKKFRQRVNFDCLASALDLPRIGLITASTHSRCLLLLIAVFGPPEAP